MHPETSQNSITSIFGAPLFITFIYPQLLHKKLRAHDLYSSPTTIWVIKTIIMACMGHVVHIGDRKGAHRDLVGKKPGRKRQLGRNNH
jgi:hypothetical protein